MTEEEIRVTFEEKVRRGIFRPVRRRIHGPDPEDRLAEAVGIVFEEYQRAARRGVVLDDALLVHACRLRAVDLGRHLARGGQRRRDVLDRRNRRDRRVEVLSLQEAAGELWRDPTAELIGSIDLEAWTRTLRPLERTLVAARYRGCSLREAAATAGVSAAHAHAHLRKLGAELARRVAV